jgi:hypothetical protein
LIDQCEFQQRCGAIDPTTPCDRYYSSDQLASDCPQPPMDEFDFDVTLATICVKAINQYWSTVACSDQAANDDLYPSEVDAGVDCSRVLQPRAPEGGDCSPYSNFTGSFKGCIQRPDGGTVECVTPENTCSGICTVAPGPGERCLNDSECRSGVYCEIVDDTLPDGGTFIGGSQCLSYVATGGDCSTGNLCDPSTDYCDINFSPAICKPLPTLGQPCDMLVCAPGFYCESLDGQSGTCQVQGTLGQPCSGDFPLYCQDPLLCIDGRCTSQQAHAGQSCSAPEVECVDSYCFSLDGGALASTCIALKDVGSACDYDEECIPAARCVSGVCSLLAGAGTACIPFGCRGGLFCDFGDVCEPIGYDSGQPCDSSNSASCADDFYCSTNSNTCQPVGTREGAPCELTSVLSCSGKAALYCGEDDLCHNAIGQPCDPTESLSCTWLRCDSATSTCQPFKAAGESCNPFGADCSADVLCVSTSDGEVCTDANCISDADGGYVCKANCQ